MTIKTGILAAAAALTLAVPAIASAQPFYGHDHGRVERREDVRRFDRERDWRRAEEIRRLEWQRHHGYRYGYYGR